MVGLFYIGDPGTTRTCDLLIRSLSAYLFPKFFLIQLIIADQYMRQHTIPKKQAISAANDQRMLDRFILPDFGQHKVFKTSYNDVQTLHNSIKSTPYQANRVLSLISKMFELSIKWKWRGDNPAKGIEKVHEEKRHRWLSDDELKKLTSALNNHPNQIAANAIRLQLLTGARIGDVLSAKWTDFNLERGVWTTPPHNTKQKRTEYLPISEAAKELLIVHREANGTHFLFHLESAIVKKILTLIV